MSCRYLFSLACCCSSSFCFLLCVGQPVAVAATGLCYVYIQTDGLANSKLSVSCVCAWHVEKREQQCRSSSCRSAVFKETRCLCRTLTLARFSLNVCFFCRCCALVKFKKRKRSIFASSPPSFKPFFSAV